ncbi:MAG: glutamine synthetase [Clostridium sp.]
MTKKLIYTLPKELHDKNNLTKILKNHPEIKFVSLVGIDLWGNDTDEKIPISLLLDDVDDFLKKGAQTDGSSVALPGIATLNNAKLDMIPDLDCTWFVDYNLDHIDPDTSLTVGTLRIPCFLIHDNMAVDSRYILKNASSTFKNFMWNLFKNHPSLLTDYNIELDDIEDILVTAATELEFWVKTPNDKAQVEQLSTSQVLKEQYWTRTKGPVRTALEESIILLEKYNLNPEMGHKEVGGVKATLDHSGSYSHVMEQLEIDWKYNDALLTADSELFIRNLVKETFRRNGLDVIFLAKPINEVAGSGEHTHISTSLKLKSGKIINLLTATKEHFLSRIGYGGLLGVLKNYEIISPFVSATNDSLRRLKPGFEAPVCTVTSLGHSVDNPSRNRTILIALIRDLENPYSTRFELRSPNPHTNTYLCIATLFLSMLDGIKYAMENNKSEDDLLKELSKTPDESADYLEKGRCYRTEENVFEHFNDEEREKFFGKSPKTVYENILFFDVHSDKLHTLLFNDVFTPKLINSFKSATLSRWVTEIASRVLNDYSSEIRLMKKLHDAEKHFDTSLDEERWAEINSLRYSLMKDTLRSNSLFSQIKDAINEDKYALVSSLILTIDDHFDNLRHLYEVYSKNILNL